MTEGRGFQHRTRLGGVSVIGVASNWSKRRPCVSSR
jgi:hypothetical protein